MHLYKETDDNNCIVFSPILDLLSNNNIYCIQYNLPKKFLSDLYSVLQTVAL